MDSWQSRRSNSMTAPAPHRETPWSRAAPNNCRRRTAPAAAAASRQSAAATWFASLEGTRPHQPGRPDHHQQQQQCERNGQRVLGPEDGRAEAFDQAENEPADQHAWNAAQPAEYADHKGLAEER